MLGREDPIRKVSTVGGIVVESLMVGGLVGRLGREAQ